MELKRKKFQGVLNILSFNRHFYIYGLLTLSVILALCFILKISFVWIGLISIMFLLGLILPLMVSAYVYDYSEYYHFNWLNKLAINKTKIQKIVNINAGFDETSYILQQHFPNAELQVFDFYNPEQHTEAAIIRARKVSNVFPNTISIVTSTIPIESEKVDIVFLLSAAHEIRNHDEKVAFLKECYRILKPNGRVIMVEHLRDVANFFAFNIGFTHFFSKTIWKLAFSNAGFTIFAETKFTPFMSIFNCKK